MQVVMIFLVLINPFVLELNGKTSLKLFMVVSVI